MDKPYSVFIQGFVGVAVSVTAAGVLWLCQTLGANQERLARIEEKVQLLSQERYSAGDALKDGQVFNSRIASLERRLEKLEIER